VRNRLTAMAAGAFLFATACGGDNSSTTAGSGATGGTTTGGAVTTGGASTGQALAAGLPCSANSQCAAPGICGVDGSGNCCAAACITNDGGCGATGCDGNGACLYPGAGTACENDFCGANTLTQRACNGAGACVAGTATPCSNNLGCNTAGIACNTSCASSKDCAANYVCNDGGCTGPQTVGPCSEDDDCFSDRCGIKGVGHCCVGDAGCVTGDPTCGATDCDPGNGACNYAGAGTACGSVLASCTSGAQQDPSICDGKGTCPAPAMLACTPFICGATACLTTCTDNTSCGSGDFCDRTHSTCCDALTDGASITVDATGGNDATPCCSVPGRAPCQSLAQTMKIIDNAQAKNVTINAAVGVGNTWNPSNEVYPIVLGWGVELSAPGLYFYDGADAGTAAEVIDIDNYSKNDTVGYASIVGATHSVVTVGPDEFMDQSLDSSAIKVETGNTLYIANASVNGSYVVQVGLVGDDVYTKTTAITVAGGASLVVGQDKSAGVTGTVTVGNAFDNELTDGWSGIVCGVSKSKGCTISDATLKAGVSSLVIEGQENVDIDAEDYATITLTSNPVIGLSPADAGFLQCEQFTPTPAVQGKPDAYSHGANATAVLLNGNVNMTFDNGTVQCIYGDAFLLNASKNGTPTLTLDNTTIQNTESGVNANAGSATVSNSIIWYNFNGVEQGTDGTNLSSLDLSSGGDGGTTTVVCNNSYESVHGRETPGVNVLNSTSASLNAQNVDWDTPGPDLFSCNAKLTSCTCEISSCTVYTADGGFDGLDAVYTSTGTVDTAGNGTSTADCTAPNAYVCPAGTCSALDPICCVLGPDEFECLPVGDICN